jgi:hypothetical protein
MREKEVDLSTWRLDKTMKRLRLQKATGDDDIPTEFFEVVAVLEYFGYSLPYSTLLECSM